MIFRLSQELAQKIKVAPKARLPLDPNPFADWSADLFTVDRVPYIIITNTRSLYTLVMRGDDIADKSRFFDAALSLLGECLPADGYGAAFRNFVAPARGKVRFSKALSKAAAGAMENLIYHVQVHLIRYDVPPGEIFWTLNDMPMSYLRNKNPRQALRALDAKWSTPERGQDVD